MRSIKRPPRIGLPGSVEALSTSGRSAGTTRPPTGPRLPLHLLHCCTTQAFWQAGNWVYCTGSLMKNALFLAAYFVFVTAANVLLKRTAEVGSGLPFFLFLIAGNLAGLAGILVYTGLLQTLPLHIAFPLSRGIAVLGVLGASLLCFHESFRATEAAGVALVTAGIIIVGGGAPRRAAGPGGLAVRTPC